MKNILCFLLLCAAVRLLGDNTIAYAAPGLWYDGFVTSTAAQKVPEKTRFQVTWDDKNLYVEIDMGGSNLKKNKEYKYRPGMWPTTESVEIFLDTDGAKKSYFQLVVSKDGIHYDSRAKRNPGYWKNVQWKAENIIDEDGHWKMRFILPFHAAGMKRPSIGDTWYFNVCRNIVTGNQSVAATWANVGRLFHNPSKFATLAFGTPEQYTAVKKRAVLEKLKRILARSAKCRIDQSFRQRLKKAEKDLDDLQVNALQDELEVIEAIRAIQ